jgi:hypothetical protein
MVDLNDDFYLFDLILDEQKIINNDDRICKLCNIPYDNICYECGLNYNKQIFEAHDIYNYKKNEKICYKKITHLKNVLNNLQDKQFKIIPLYVLNLIKLHVRDNVNFINIEVIKYVLKKNNLTKYVKNINSILFLLTQKKPPHIPKEIEIKLIKYFNEIDKIFNQCEKKKRINFLNYYYVIYKLLDLFELPDLLINIPKLKSKYRLKNHDKIWAQICNILNWNYKKTTYLDKKYIN